MVQTCCIRKSGKKLKVDRIRRHIGRTTPDRLEEWFDPYKEGENHRRDEWVHRFEQNMALKHGPKPHQIVIHSYGYDRGDFKYKVILEVKLLSPEQIPPYDIERRGVQPVSVYDAIKGHYTY